MSTKTRKNKVLLIHPNNHVLEEWNKTLSSQGYDCLLASSPVEANKLFSDEVSVVVAEHLGDDPGSVCLSRRIRLYKKQVITCAEESDVPDLVVLAVIRQEGDTKKITRLHADQRAAQYWSKPALAPELAASC